MLAADQAELARGFASKALARREVARGPASPSATGVPVLDGAVAWIACRLRDLHDGGDHEIAVGEVLDLGGDGGEPLRLLRRRLPAASSRAGLLEQRPAGPGGAQREEEDDQRRDGHDPGLAADDRERDQALALRRAASRSRARSSSRSAAPARAASASRVTTSGSTP